MSTQRLTTTTANNGPRIVGDFATIEDANTKLAKVLARAAAQGDDITRTTTEATAVSSDGDVQTWTIAPLTEQEQWLIDNGGRRY